MLSIVLMLVLLGIAAYWRANGWILALAAIAGLALANPAFGGLALLWWRWWRYSRACPKRAA